MDLFLVPFTLDDFFAARRRFKLQRGRALRRFLESLADQKPSLFLDFGNSPRVSRQENETSLQGKRGAVLH